MIQVLQVGNEASTEEGEEKRFLPEGILHPYIFARIATFTLYTKHFNTKLRFKYLPNERTSKYSNILAQH